MLGSFNLWVKKSYKDNSPGLEEITQVMSITPGCSALHVGSNY